MESRFMQCQTTAALAITLIFGASDAALASDATVAREIMRLELEWSAATVVHDPSVVERLLADDYVGTDGRGILTSKQDEIKEASAPDPSAPPPAVKVTEEIITDMKVRVFGNAAILNGRTVQQTDRAGVKGEVQFRRTTVWVKRNSRWQCVSFHGSRLLNPPTGAITR